MATRTLPVTAPPAVAPPASEDIVVCAEDLTKRFGAVLAVDDLSFAPRRGTITGVLGPNGADTRTTVRMLLHLVRPTPSRPANRRSRARLRRPAGRVKQ